MKVNLDQWYKCDIDRKVYKELTKRSDWQGIKHISLWIIFLFLAGYMAFITWGTWWTVLWFLIYGNIYMACNPVWHECGHRTAFKTRWMNEFFYHVGSFMYNFEPIRWRWSQRKANTINNTAPATPFTPIQNTHPRRNRAGPMLKPCSQSVMSTSQSKRSAVRPN